MLMHIFEHYLLVLFCETEQCLSVLVTS
jgi:hypothetical protein